MLWLQAQLHNSRSSPSLSVASLHHMLKKRMTSLGVLAGPPHPGPLERLGPVWGQSPLLRLMISLPSRRLYSHNPQRLLLLTINTMPCKRLHLQLSSMLQMHLHSKQMLVMARVGRTAWQKYRSNSWLETAHMKLQWKLT